MELEYLRKYLERWDLPFSPFRYPEDEDIDQQMEEEVHKLGAESANQFVEFIIKLDDERSSLLGTLADFIGTYAKYYPQELIQAVLKNLRPDGPVSLVETLENSHSSEAVIHLKQVLDLNEASDDLLVAFAGTLGRIGSNEDINILYSLMNRQNLAPEVRSEINSAIYNLTGKRITSSNK